MTIKDWTIVLLQSKDAESGYATLFEEYQPKTVIYLHYDHLSENDPIQDLVTESGGEFYPVPIKRIENATPENRIVFNSIPFEVLRTVINALREINNSALKGQSNIVFPIFSGSSLHSQLMLGVAVIIGAEVATIDTSIVNGEKIRTLNPQRWIRKSLKVEFNTPKQRNALRLFLIEYANSDSQSFYPSQWLTGKQLASGKGSANSIPLGGSAIKKSLQISIDNGLVEENSESGKHLYRLTGSGWLVALKLFREAIQSDNQCPLEGLDSPEEKGALCRRFISNYNEKNASPKGRIMGVKGILPKENERRIGAIEIANFLPHVNHLITIYSKIDDNIQLGLNDPTMTLGEDISAMWNNSAKNRGWNPISETHFNAKGDLEKLFSEVSMWIWTSMHKNSDSSNATEWEMDVTQFDRQQNLTCGLFGYYLGLPQTYIVKRTGKGVRGVKVPEVNVQVDKLKLQLPNASAGSLLTQIRGKLAAKYLVALSLWEEEQEIRNSSNSMFEGDVDSFLAELGNEEQSLEQKGIKIQDLRAWVQGKIAQGDKLVPNLGKNRSMRKADDVLINSGLVNVTTVGVRTISLTPLGRLIADWLKSELGGIS